MDRLHGDIDARAEKFSYIEYYDASLRDKKARDAAVAADNVNMLDDRRKPLAEVNPLLAQNSELPPEPSIEKKAYEYAGMNLNAVASEALDELDEIERTPVSHVTKKAVDPQNEPESVSEYSVNSADDDLKGAKDNGVKVHDMVPTEPSEVEAEEETADSEDDDDAIYVDEIEKLVESLIERDADNQYGVQDIAAKFLTLKERWEDAEDDEAGTVGEQLVELYESAVAIEAELDKRDGE